MSATVHDLTSRRRDQLLAESCPACARRADALLCYPHRLAALGERLRQTDADHAGLLLIDREVLEGVITDALSVVDSITAECLTTPERNVR